MKNNNYSLYDIGWSILFYSICSNLMTLTNKISIKALYAPFFLTWIQFVFVIFFLLFVFFILNCHIIFKKNPLKNLTLSPNPSIKHVSLWSIVSVLFSSMLITSFYSLRYVNVSTVVVFNSIRILFSAILERMIIGFDFDKNIIVCMIGILMGSFIYSVHDISFSMIGYGFCFCNMLIAIFEKIIQKYLMSTYQIPFSNIDMIFYNNLIGIFFILPFLFIFREHIRLQQRWKEIKTYEWIFILFSMIMGLLISYGGFHLQRRISATTFLIINNCNKCFLIFVTYLILKEQLNIFMVIGFLFSLLSSIGYGYYKLKLNQNKNNVNHYIRIILEEK